MPAPVSLQSAAWLLRGLSSLPGQLALTYGRFAFTAAGSGTAWPWQLRRLERAAQQPGLAARLAAGDKALVFDLPVAPLRVRFPWYYFTGGLTIQGNATVYRFSFGPPANPRLPVDRAEGWAVGGRAWQAALRRHQG